MIHGPQILGKAHTKLINKDWCLVVSMRGPPPVALNNVETGTLFAGVSPTVQI